MQRSSVTQTCCWSPVCQRRAGSRCTGTFWQRSAPESCQWVVPGGRRPVGWPEPSAFARDTGCSCCTCKPYSDVPSSRCGFLYWNLYCFIRPLQIAQANASIAPSVAWKFMDLWKTQGSGSCVRAGQLLGPPATLDQQVPSNLSSLESGFTGEDRGIVLSPGII